MTKVPKARRWGRTKAAAALIAALPLAPLWFSLPRGSKIARAVETRFHALILAGHGMKVRVHGTPLRTDRTLYIANHISWIDIPLLATVLDASFVAKDDIAAWPVIGPLAGRHGTLFVARDRMRSINHQRQSLSDTLSARRGVILFPEGTTGNGDGLLPFRTSLFAAADEGTTAVQPVAIVYGRRDGRALSPAERRAIAWLGEDELLPHAFALARTAGLAVDVYFEQPVVGGNRKALAEACRRSILARLLPEDQAATLNRVA